MEEEAKVVELMGKAAKLSIVKSDACGGCQACTKGRGGEMFIVAENSLGAKKGDRVRIEVDPQLVLKGSFFAYLMPIIGLITGTVLTGQVTGSEGMKVLGGIGGFIISSILIYYYFRKSDPKQSFAATITKIFG